MCYDRGSTFRLQWFQNYRGILSSKSSEVYAFFVVGVILVVYLGDGILQPPAAVLIFVKISFWVEKGTS